MITKQEFDDFLQLVATVSHHHEVEPIFNRLVEAKGVRSVRGLAYRLWQTPKLRASLLTFLRDNAFFDLYLTMSRHYILENALSGTQDWLWDANRIAADHVTMGQARDFLEFIESNAILENTTIIPKIQVLVALNKIEDALALARQQTYPKDWRSVYCHSWLEHMLGSKDTSAALRKDLLEMSSEIISSIIEKNPPHEAARLIQDGYSIYNILPFVGGEIWKKIAPRCPDLCEKLITFVAQAVSDDINPATCSTSIRIRDCRNLSAQDLALIASAGMSALALQLNAFGVEYVELYDRDQDRLRQNISEIKDITDIEFFHATLGVPPWLGDVRNVNLLRGIELHNGMRSICPWTGAPRLTRESYFYKNMIFYHFEGQPNYWIIATTHVFTRSWLWCPERDILIGLHPIIDVEPYLAEFIVWLEETRAQQRTHPETSLAIIHGIQPNIGHHYHNELSGLYRLKGRSYFEKEAVCVVGPHAPYKGQELLLPDLEHISCDSEDEMQEYFRARRHFIIWPTDVVSYHGLAQEVLDRASRDTKTGSPLNIAQSDNIKIIFGLRTKQRCLYNTEEMLNKLTHAIANELGRSKRWKQATLIFDGYTMTRPDDTEAAAGIARELYEFEQIKSKLSDHGGKIAITTAIGLDLYQKAALFCDASVAICPKGNGHLPTVAWVTKTPVVVHSNSLDISGAHYENALNCVPAVMRCIDRDAIIDDLYDAPSYKRWHPDYAESSQSNYELKIDALIAHVVDLIRAADE